MRLLEQGVFVFRLAISSRPSANVKNINDGESKGSMIPAFAVYLFFLVSLFHRLILFASYLNTFPNPTSLYSPLFLNQHPASRDIRPFTENLKKNLGVLTFVSVYTMEWDGMFIRNQFLHLFVDSNETCEYKSKDPI